MSPTVDTNYTRVLPRDLFNESKLLKCIGKLCLLIHDELVPVKMGLSDNGESFKVGMLQEGSLTIQNLEISIKKKVYTFKTTYNGKSNYPLFVENDYCDYRVFDENGNFDEEFIEFCKTV